MIKIENLTKSYRTPHGRHYVFKDLNVEFPEEKVLLCLAEMGQENRHCFG